MSFRRLGICRSWTPRCCDIAEGPYENADSTTLPRFSVALNRPTGTPWGSKERKGERPKAQGSRVLLVFLISTFWYKRLSRSSG
jgi:hypothetical protein